MSSLPPPKNMLTSLTGAPTAPRTNVRPLSPSPTPTTPTTPVTPPRERPSGPTSGTYAPLSDKAKSHGVSAPGRGQRDMSGSNMRPKSFPFFQHKMNGVK